MENTNRNYSTIMVAILVMVTMFMAVYLVHINEVDAVEWHGPYKVIQVDGGGNIIIDKDGKETRVIMIGVYCGGYESPEWESAKQYTEDRLLGKYVRIAYDEYSDMDVFCERAYVYDENGTMINGELLYKGIAAYCLDGKNNAHERMFKNFERKARNEKIGIWK